MHNGPFDALPPSPFDRLRGLLDAIEPPCAPLSLALGEPQHAPPAFATAALADAAPSDYGRYPPIGGTPDWQGAAGGWLQRRFALDADFLAGAQQILPLAGTREGLFLAAQLAPQKADGLMAMPNPFYQVYASAAVAAGATPLYLDAPAESGFLPDLDALQPDELARLRALYLCSPANPQGAIADAAYLEKAYRLAKQYDFLLLVDECYSEIYDAAGAPPPSMLQTMQAEGDANAPILVFHSLSKRSNLAGLRSGLVTGGRDVMQAFYRLRMVAGPQTSLPALAAAALAWQDDAHVEDNRATYRAKLDLAEGLFGTRFGFYRPPGGFFFWLNVGDGAAACEALWRHAGLRVLPGAYLTQETRNGNIGAPYIRVALVAPAAQLEDGLARMIACLDAHGFEPSDHAGAFAAATRRPA